MKLSYEVISTEDIDCIRDLCNELMVFQKSKAYITPHRFDNMCFETRMIPSVKNAKDNYFMIAKDGNDVVAYVYSNISDKRAYDNDFATFFDIDLIDNQYVGCLSQFYIKEEYRRRGIGGILFDSALDWMNSHSDITDTFIFVSNGNDGALEFYKSKGFIVSHDILDGFITVLKNA